MAVGKYAMSKATFYDEAKSYWEQISPTVNGMLGGYGSISNIDVKGSINFLKPMLLCEWKERVGSERALDCGAGIGRVTKHTLLPLFQTVDLVEQEQKFLDQAPAFLDEGASKIGKYICCGLQEFVPQAKHYDVIWCQWVLGHLTDKHLVDFFKRCKEGLRDGGVICVKENISKEGYVYDEQDSSVTRSSKELTKIFSKAGLTILKEETQTNFPLEIYTVKMFALR
ncbi:N-terminal Xaa-Pro-Lys N-methyltransferase 1-like [Asterias rubens]|uniref:N-terminal Xaa-Pro-Lys N-methyltransferase 1-like n=1 Tax=Asterias rubens TaxID=7604 RepID=UPI00145592B1|nr:N-terminal Xaa-Pro-Lys N-methyltransferase 1-like [Asterias rubens]